MALEELQNLGIVATGTAAFGLVARYGIQRVSSLVQEGIERSTEAAEYGIERHAEALERGIERFFEKKTSQHQAELEARRVVSSGLHEKRASIVPELYRRFVRFERDIRALTAGTSSAGTTDELLEAATSSGDAFGTYYREHRIYFPRETCDAVESVQDAMNDVLDEYRVGVVSDGRSEQRTARQSRPVDGRPVTGGEIPERASELETRLRELLGVDLDEARLAAPDS